MTDVSEDTLPDLMRRATDGLEPDTTDLVSRGMRKGVRLRRRRTAGIAVAAASALVVTAGAFAFATQRGGPAAPDNGAPVAGAVSSAPSARSTGKPAAAVKETKTLRTLRAVLPKGARLSEPKTGGDNLLGNSASFVVIDGRGSSLVEVIVGWKSNHNCRAKEAGMTCTRLPDGSPLTTIVTPGGKYDNYVKSNHARWHRNDGSFVMITSTNTKSMDHGPATRPTPVLSVSELKRIIQDPRWTPPPRRPGTAQDNDLDPSLRGH